MRMWNVNPKMLCRQHLLGEHVELHMFVGSINKGINVNRYVRDGLLFVKRLRIRHLQLRREMRRRGYNHRSPLPKLRSDFTAHVDQANFIDVQANIVELKRRCSDCRARIEAIEKCNRKPD